MRSRTFRFVTYGGLLAAVALVVVLSLQVRALRAQLVEARRRALFPLAGETVPPFDAVTLDGAPVRVGEGPDGARQLLLVFNTTCSICLETLPAWRLLDSLVADAPGLTVLGWSQHPDSLTRPYVQDHGLRFPVVVPDVRWLRPYKVEGVPNTLLIRHDGRVLYARAGALTPTAVDSAVVAARGG